ncbi:MAG: NAD(P)H-dependent oxidoreductase [Saprospiraceae bacterium]|nr:NAD(P)H-dependent oxidoreductase [Saprospiraceae bacterium]
MPRILAFAGSTSSLSINKQLVSYVLSYFDNFEIDFIDLNDYEMAIFNVDREKKDGIPASALALAEKIDHCDLILISLAEHNGAYSAAFKNTFDWISRIKGRKAWGDKKMILMATSTGARGGVSVLDIASKRFPINGGNVIATYSLPSFNDHFSAEFGIMDDDLKSGLLQTIKNVKSALISD